MLVMILVVALIILILIPLKIDCYLYCDIENKILTVCVYLYGIIKIVGGYFERIDSEVFFHYTNKKAMVIKIGDMRENKIKLKDLSTVKLKTIIPIISMPNDANFYGYGSAITALSDVLMPYFSKEAKQKNTKTVIIIGRDEALKTYIKLKFSTNIIAIIITIVKIRTRNEK